MSTPLAIEEVPTRTVLPVKIVRMTSRVAGNTSRCAVEAAGNTYT